MVFMFDTICDDLIEKIMQEKNRIEYVDCAEARAIEQFNIDMVWQSTIYETTDILDLCDAKYILLNLKI